MALKFENLTSTPVTIHKVPRLIWTDIATNVLVGSKSVLTAFPNSQMEVEMFRRKITYKYVYAIPAMVCWIVWLGSIVLLVALLFVLDLRLRLNLRMLRSLINQLSVCRPLVAAEGIDVGRGVNMSTKEWVSTVGKVEHEEQLKPELELQCLPSENVPARPQLLESMSDILHSPDHTTASKI